MTEETNQSLYELMGGAETIQQIVNKFYPKVKEEPLISSLFDDDIGPIQEKQYMFLTQFFGGPSLYSDEKGHPMMRARHLPFKITKERADAWLDCMRRALAETELSRELQQMILIRLSGPAYHFINSTSEHNEEGSH